MVEHRRISSFSVLLLMAVAAVVGIACFPHLKVQYNPTAATRNISVSYQYPGASARIVEAEVTAPLEGVLSTIRACSGVSSVSRDGSGSISMTVRRRADLESVRFEVASQIRNLYSKLPAGCTYPSISLNSRGEKTQTAISYSIRSALPSQEIASFVERELLYPLSTVEGVSSVEFYGQTPFEWVITFDAPRCETLGITAADIRSALTDNYTEEIVGMTQAGGQAWGVRLRNEIPGLARNDDDRNRIDFGSIPVKRVGERVVRLEEIAAWRYQEALPNSYYRVNGLNVLTLSVVVSSDANLIGVVRAVKARVEELKSGFPKEIGISVSYDYSEYISEELDKIYFRTMLCLLILLVFVFVMARSWRYMLVIAITLAVNLLISVALYFFLGLQIHIYTLAGVTVSLGIIIDNSIVMIDHYARCGDRKVFPSLLCAVLTTVAALLVILLMPEQEKANLTDFTWVIVINLCVSLAVAYLFVPALLDYFPVAAREAKPGRKRHQARRRAAYGRYIRWGVRHRWMYWVALVVLFGIPTCLLPAKFGEEGREPKRYEAVLNKIVGWRPYADNKSAVDKILGSTFGLFNKAMVRSDFYREPARPQLYVRAGMPEGCTVQQLDEVMRSMENYLAHFDEIDVFETRITRYDNGTITVWFKPEFEGTWLPARIKGEVIAMATNFGGANWRVSGIDDSYFNNNIVSDSRSYSITLTGYNADELNVYGERLIEHLSGNRRVSEPEIWGAGWNDRPRTEFNLRYDYEALSGRGISPYLYYAALQSPLYDASVLSLPYDGEYVNVRLVSSDKEVLDLWHVDNTAVALDGERKMKLSEIGSITKSRTGLSIQKENQSYQITVRFNFIGSYQMANKAMKEAADWMNERVLLLGFRASDDRGGWYYDQKEKYAWLILLVIALIFVICAVYFNSLRLPLAIILMIPLSFVGLFLAFGLSDFTFDKGGFAAFVMLSGITVNAGIYLVSEWQAEHHPLAKRGAVRPYLRAVSRKMVPISLTILSTVLGLIPFLFDGPGEVFWFAFAVGTIAGLLFSALALLFYLPVFVLRRAKRE